MNNEKDFLGKEPIGKLLWSLAIPTITAQLINMLYNIVDRIYIGHIPESGAMALTGVGVCMPLIMIVSAFAALVGSGGAPRAVMGHGYKWTTDNGCNGYNDTIKHKIMYERAYQLHLDEAVPLHAMFG